MIKNLSLLVIILNINLALGQKSSCQNPYVVNLFELSICNENKWTINQEPPVIKIKSPSLKTYITIYSKPNKTNLSLNETLKNSINQDKKSRKQIKITNQKSITIDNVPAIIYKAEDSSSTNEKFSQTTCILIRKGRAYYINNNCYSSCNNTDSIFSEVLNNISFLRKNEWKLSGKQLKALKKFRKKLTKSLIKKDTSLFNKLIINKELTIDLVEDINDEYMKKRFSRVIKNHWKSFEKDFIKETKESFIKIINQSSNIKLDTKKLKFIRIEKKSTQSISPEKQGLNVKYYFSINSVTYYLEINSIDFINGKWYITKFNSSYINKE